MIGLSPSKQLLLFCLAILAGVALGSNIELSLTLLGYLTVVWAVIYLSKQEPLIENISLLLFGISTGWLVWQATGGETWIYSNQLTAISSQLIRVRDVVVDRIFFTLPEPHGSLLTGIILGNRVKLDKELIDQFKIIGVTHLIAVSGYNLTILTTNIRSLFRPILGRSAIYVCLVTIIGFVLITGAPASILRAAVMSGVVLLAEFLGRPSKAISILVLTTAVLVLFEPKIILDIGFQLSVAATYGLVRLSPIFTYGLRKIPLVPASIKAVLAETLAATLMTAPIILLYFERLSLISPLANVLMLPLIPLIMGLGLIGAACLLVYQVVGRVVIMLSWPLLAWIIGVSNHLSSLKFASTNLSLSPLVISVVIVALVIVVEYFNTMFAKLDPDETSTS